MSSHPILPRYHLAGFAAGLVLAASVFAADPKTPPPSPPLPAASESALTASAAGWIDLLEKPDLSDWERACFPATKPLSETNPWRYDAATRTLHCDATGIHEMLLHRAVRGDGIFHVEFRYPDAPAKPNSGAFVRTAPDASTWYQAQLAPSGLGMVFGQVSSGAAKPTRFSAGARYPELFRPAGEWNVIEITCQDSELTLWVNGHGTARTKNLTSLQGQVGLEAEFNPIEFRQLKFKPLR